MRVGLIGRVEEDCQGPPGTVGQSERKGPCKRFGNFAIDPAEEYRQIVKIIKKERFFCDGDDDKIEEKDRPF